MDQIIHLPWYLKAFLALGGAAMVWKAIQGSVPKLIAWLLPLALRATDVAMAFILSNPAARWLVLGNKDKSKEILNAAIDGVQSIIDAVQKRALEDIDAADSAPVAEKKEEPAKE